MTCIAQYPTKKAFKAAIEENPQTVAIEDPSVFAPWKGNIEDALTRTANIFVTNHPKRSWFAHVTRKNGKYRVR